VIRNDEGGFSKVARRSGEGFLSSLRSYQPIKYQSAMANPDYFGWAQKSTIRSYKDVETDRSRKESVKRLVDRLAQPKVPRYKSVDFRILKVLGTKYRTDSEKRL